MSEILPKILPKVANSTSLLGSFTCRKFTTWDPRLYFPSEGRRAENIFARKIRRLRPGLNPRTRVPEASTLTYRPPKPLWVNYYCTKLTETRGNMLSIEHEVTFSPPCMMWTQFCLQRFKNECRHLDNGTEQDFSSKRRTNLCRIHVWERIGDKF